MSEEKDISNINKNDTPNDDTLGVSFVVKPEEELPKKPGPEIYETANKHLAASAVPGRPEENIFNVTRAFDEDTVEMGTIVSDKKRKRTPIGKTLKSAFNEWWGKTRESLDGGIELIEEKLDEKEPEEIPSTEDRSDTIKKAREHSLRPPKEDHNVIIEKSKTLSKDAERLKGVPYKIVDTPPEPPKWKGEGDEVISKKSEDIKKESFKIQKPDLRKDMIAPVVAKRIEKNIHSYKIPGERNEAEKKWEMTDLKKTMEVERGVKENLGEDKTTLPPIKPKDKGFIRPVSTVFVSPKVTKHSDYVEKKDESPTVSHKEIPKNSIPVSQPVEIVTPAHAPIQKLPIEPPPPPSIEKPPVKTAVEAGVSATTTHRVTVPDHDVQMQIRSASVTLPQTKKSNWGTLIRVLIIILIISTGVTLAIFAVSKFNIFESEPDRPDDISPPGETVVVRSFFTPDLQKPIMLSSDKERFFSTLKGLVQTSERGVTQFYPTTQGETVLQNLSTWQIFQTLDTNLSQNTIRSLDTTSMFGAVATDTFEPFIIVRSYNFDSLFSGFLEWELNMYDDLSPLFGATPLDQILFKDSVKNNSSSRVLYNEAGEEVLLYTFVNRNTVVITSSSDALSKIIERF